MRYEDMPHPNKKLTPIRAIKFYCKKICCAGDTKSWQFCQATRCTLYPYRLGKRPEKKPFEAYHTPKTKDEEKQADLTAFSKENSLSTEGQSQGVLA